MLDYIDRIDPIALGTACLVGYAICVYVICRVLGASTEQGDEEEPL